MSDALDVHLSAEHQLLFKESQDLAADVFAPAASGAPEGSINRPLVKLLADEGLLGRLFSQDGDGWRPDVSALELCLIREGLAYGCTEAETAFALQGLGSFPLLQAGQREVVDEWIPQIAAGEAVVGFALSEPQAGTDVSALSLAAERVDGGYLLNGEKIWISNAPDADVYSVFARTSQGSGSRGLTAFLVPGASDGLSGEHIELLAPHPIGRLVLCDVFVPDSHVLGDVDRGMGVAMRTLDMFRPSVGAFAVGMARAAIDATISYTSERQAFGGPLSGQQAIAHRVADVATRVQAARLLVHNAATAYDHGVRPTTQAAAMAKLMATEVAQEAVDMAIQFHGATSLRRHHLLEHLYREVRAPRIYEGASEIQREIIARALYAPAPKEKA
jgi:alkylation response protein AidB-like acyl-CoA dehydrogenase